MRVFHICLATSLIVVSAIFSPAQQVPNDRIEPRTQETSPVSQVTVDKQYRIGIGDVLEVRVFNRPQLSRDAVRVDGRGLVAMPLIDEDISAACKTESELAHEIATRYLKYQRNPNVSVFVKEFNSQPVAVIGAVNQPGRFQLQRRVRLLELMAFAGGPSERAGGRIDIIRTPHAECRSTTVITDPSESLASNLISLKFADTLNGDDGANPYVQPGDIISVPEAEQAFVVGNVLKPSAINLREPVTVSRAIAMAGGVMPDTRLDRIRIVRHSSRNNSKAEIFIDLRAIDKLQAEDVALQSGDIVDVGVSGGKRFLRTLFSAIAPAAANVPVRVVR